jgi:hypothetical protein
MPTGYDAERGAARAPNVTSPAFVVADARSPRRVFIEVESAVARMRAWCPATPKGSKPIQFERVAGRSVEIGTVSGENGEVPR